MTLKIIFSFKYALHYYCLWDYLAYFTGCFQGLVSAVGFKDIWCFYLAAGNETRPSILEQGHGSQD